MTAKLRTNTASELTASELTLLQEGFQLMTNTETPHDSTQLKLENILGVSSGTDAGIILSANRKIPVTNGTGEGAKASYYLTVMEGTDDGITRFELTNSNSSPIGVFEIGTTVSTGGLNNGKLSFHAYEGVDVDQVTTAFDFIKENLASLNYAVKNDNFNPQPVADPQFVDLDFVPEESTVDGATQLRLSVETPGESSTDDQQAIARRRASARSLAAQNKGYVAPQAPLPPAIEDALSEIDAAVRIQAAFRGYRQRRQLQAKGTPVKTPAERDKPNPIESQENNLNNPTLAGDPNLSNDGILNRTERDKEIAQFGTVDYSDNGLLNFFGSGFNNGKDQYEHDRIKMDDNGLFTAHFDLKRAVNFLDHHKASTAAASAFLTKMNPAGEYSAVDFQFVAYDNETYDHRSELGPDHQFDPKAKTTSVKEQELLFIDPATGELKKIIGSQRVNEVRDQITAQINTQKALSKEETAFQDQLIAHLKDSSVNAPAGTSEEQLAVYKNILGIDKLPPETTPDAIPQKIEESLQSQNILDSLRREIKYGRAPEPGSKLATNLEGKTGSDRQEILASFERHQNREISKQVMCNIAKGHNQQLEESRSGLAAFRDHFTKHTGVRGRAVFSDIATFPVTVGDGICTSVNPAPNFGAKHPTANIGKISFNTTSEGSKQIQEQFVEIPGTGLFTRVQLVPAEQESFKWENGKKITIAASEEPQITIDHNTIWQKSYNKEGKPITIPYKVNNNGLTGGVSDELKRGKKGGNRGFFDPKFIQRRFNEFAIEAAAQIDGVVQCATYQSIKKNEKPVSISFADVAEKTISDINAQIKAEISTTPATTPPDKLQKLLAKRDKALQDCMKKGVKVKGFYNDLVVQSGKGAEVQKSGNKIEDRVAAYAAALTNPLLKGAGVAQSEFLRMVAAKTVEVAQGQFLDKPGTAKIGGDSKETIIRRSIQEASNQLVKSKLVTNESELEAAQQQLVANIENFATARHSQQYQGFNWKTIGAGIVTLGAANLFAAGYNTREAHKYGVVENVAQSALDKTAKERGGFGHQKNKEQLQAIEIIQSGQSLTEEQVNVLHDLHPDSVAVVLQSQGIAIPEQPEAVKPKKFKETTYLKTGHSYQEQDTKGELNMAGFNSAIDNLRTDLQLNDSSNQALDLLKQRQFEIMAAKLVVDTAAKFKTHKDQEKTTRTGDKQGWKGAYRPAKEGYTQENRATFINKAISAVCGTEDEQNPAKEEAFRKALIDAGLDKGTRRGVTAAMEANPDATADTSRRGQGGNYIKSNSDQSTSRKAFAKEHTTDTQTWVARVEKEAARKDETARAA